MAEILILLGCAGVGFVFSLAVAYLAFDREKTRSQAINATLGRVYPSAIGLALSGIIFYSLNFVSGLQEGDSNAYWYVAHAWEKYPQLHKDILCLYKDGIVTTGEHNGLRNRISKIEFIQEKERLKQIIP